MHVEYREITRKICALRFHASVFEYMMLRAFGYTQGKNQVTAPAGPGQPIRLVAYDQDGNFYIPPEATAALRRIKGPLAVVSICGRARQGKSFILNQLLGRSSGFVVGPTHRPCTKGLWMWSMPIARTAPDGSRYHLLLLDTEGIESYDQTGTYSTQIFSLSILLSSLFIFNQMGGIDEAALDNLALVTEMTKHIRVKAATSSSSAQDLAQFSPAFVWLLRDFYLDLSEDGRQISPKEYLEIALQASTASSPAIQAKNEIRSSIRALFPDRDCFQLVRPLNDEKELQILDKIPMERLRPEFRSGLEAFTEMVFARAVPKRVGAATLTGPILAALTLSYIEALNKGAVPTIATSWQSAEEGQCRAALHCGLAAYAAAFNKATPPEEAAFRAAHEAALRAALAAFEEEAMGTGSVRQHTEDQLQETVREQFEEHCSKAFLAAEVRCAEELRSMEAQLQGMAQAGAEMEEVFAALEGMLGAYERNNSGPRKWPRLCTFLHATMRGVMATVAQARINKANQQVEEAEGASEAAERSMAEWKQRAHRSEGQVAGLQQTVGEQARSLAARVEVEDLLQGEKDALKSKVEGLQAKYVDLKGSAGRDEGRLRAQVVAGEEQVRKLRGEAEESRQQVGRMRSDSQKQHAAEMRQQEEEVARMQRQREEAEGRVHQLTAAVKEKEEQEGEAALRAQVAEQGRRESEEEGRATRETMKGVKEEVQAALSQAQALERGKAEVEGQLMRVMAEVEEVGQKVEVMGERARAAEAVASVGNRIISALRSTVEELKGEATTHTMQLAEAQAEQGVLQERLGRIEKEAESAQKEVRRLTDKLESDEKPPERTAGDKGRKRQRVSEGEGEAMEMSESQEQQSEVGGEGSEMSGRRDVDGGGTPSKPKPMTKQELSRSIMEAGLGHEIAQLRNPSRAALLAVYEKTLK